MPVESNVVGAVDPPRCDRRSFRPELTPTWLATVSVLAGQRPPDLRRPVRVAYLGCGSGAVPSVAAAVHPQASVWAWDIEPGRVEATRRLRDGAELSNLHVHEHPDLPTELGGGPLDMVVVDGVVDAVSDDLRAALVTAIAATLRPGGLLCVNYRTVVGWTEVAPVVRVLRAAVARDPRPVDDAVASALGLLEDLRARGAPYLTERPVVAAWLDELLAAPVSQVVEDHLARDLRPLSHAQVIDALRPIGCTFIGRATLAGPADDLPADVAPTIDGARSSVRREAFSDIVARPAHRCDLLRLGVAPLSRRERTHAVAALELAPVVDDLADGLPSGVADRLLAGPLAVADLGVDAGRRAELVRRLLRSGQVHPVAPGGGNVDPDPARRLSAVLGRPPTPVEDRLVVSPTIGSAVPATPKLSRTRLVALGVG